jgi:hypothetical protein
MAKKLKIKLPKRMGGVKIPKSVRKGVLPRVLNSSGGQLVLAEALLALGGMYAARKLEPHTAAGDVLRHPLENLRAGRDWSHGATDRLTRALGAGVKAFRAALHDQSPGAEPSREGSPESSEAAADADAAKKASSRSGSPLRETSTGRH